MTDSNPLTPQDDSSFEGFPIIPEVDPKLLLKKLLSVAVATRAGIPVVGPKSAGKSFGIERVIDEWDADEMQARSADPTYSVRRVLFVGRMKASSERDCLIDVLTALRRTPPSLRARGGRKTERLLLLEFVHGALEQNIVALVIEEGEFLTREAMAVLRDIMAEAALLDRRTGNARGENQGGLARGIGVLAVGAEALRHMVEASKEDGHRWLRVESVGMAPPSLIPEIYQRWFPQFSQHISTITPSTWALQIKQLVGQQPTPIGLLIRHAQLYLEALRGFGPPIRRSDAPFVQAVFERTWRRPEWGEAA